MPLNLITDAWIPVLDAAGNRRIIEPWRIADRSILRPDWPRADLNIACLELLIGLVFMADPPVDIDDWEERQSPDPARLRVKLAAYEAAFNLTGEGPLFLQDDELLKNTPKASDIKAPDILFIDSAGAQTVRDNADLMVHRARYSGLDLPLAAMALYTLQAHAPKGGRGNRTSMRGGGPIVTLVDPGQGLWSLVWANVPYSNGNPSAMADLPWMRPTRISDKKLETTPPQDQRVPVESFFGMPRRFRLIVEDDVVKGVIQKPYGTDYASWMHPLSPYYRQKAGELALPAHPKAGAFGYRHWLGIIAQADDAVLKERAYCLQKWPERAGLKPAKVIVVGWAMDNMKPLDFTYSVQPLIDLPDGKLTILAELIATADKAALAMCEALVPVLAKGKAREAEREGFYLTTESAFDVCLKKLKSGGVEADICADWLKTLRTEALRRFDRLALPALDQRHISDIRKILKARKKLMGTLAGYDKFWKSLFEVLGMELPVNRGKAA